MKQPRQWRLLKRHPLSNQYQDLKGNHFRTFVDGVRANGIVKNRKITLHEGMVLDGWQLQRACVEIGKKPGYEGLPANMTAEEYVQTMNDLRRHETQEAAESRIADRRKRVAEARADGQSIRAIAEQEGVSKTTIQIDLIESAKPPNHEDNLGGQGLRNQQKHEDFAVSGVQGWTPEETSENTPIIGRDGKTYSATRPRRKVGKPLFDDREVKETIGKLVRLLRKRADVYGSSPYHEKCKDSIDELLTRFEQWRKA
jgi:hypothetical protein